MGDVEAGQGGAFSSGSYVRLPAVWRKVCLAVARGEYVAIVGPKACGKTLLLKDVLATLRAQGECACVYADLQGWQVGQTGDLFRTVAWAVHQAIPMAGTGAASRAHLPDGRFAHDQLPDLRLSPDGVKDGQDFRHFLAALLGVVPYALVVALDHIESLPRSLAKALLRCFRVVYSERGVHPEYSRVVVVAAGALNLFELTTSHVSPFNIATLVPIPDANEEQGRELIDQVAAQLGVRFSARAVGRILEAAEGDYYLIQHLSRLAAAQPRWVAPRVARPAVERALAGLEASDPEQDPSLAERLRLVEGNPDTLRTVLDVLAGHKVKRRELLTEFDSAELTGVVKVVGHRYVVRNPVCERLLRRYFIPRRVARLFSAFGRWDEAIRYFEESDPATSPAERAEYLAAVLSRIYGDGDERQAFEGVAQALANAYRVRRVVVYRYVEADHQLALAAWRGPAAEREGRREPGPCLAIPLRERSEQPEARVYDGDDYLLEKDGAGNSLLLFPLPSGGRLPTVGVVTLYNHFPVERFVERREEVREMAGFLAQAGRAIASQREKQELLRRERQLYQKLAEDHAILASLYQVSTQLRDSLDPVEVLEAITASLQKMFDLATCTIGLLDEAEQRLEFVAHLGLEASTARLVEDLPPLLWRTVREEKQRLYVPDLALQPDLARVLERQDLASFAVLPLQGRERFLGILTMGSTKRLDMDKDDWDLIAALMSQAAVAIENAQLHQQAQQARRSLDDSLKILTHQLRAEPAFVTNTLATMLAGKLGDLNPMQRDRLEKAQRRLDEHHRLIDNLSRYGRLKGGRIVLHKEAAQLKHTVQALVADYRGRAERRGLVLEAQLGRLPEIEADEGMIEIVVVNLLDNACKFTPPGGRVGVELWADGEGVHLVVDDTGPGIPVEARDKVFDEYYQVEAAHMEKGAGLGLYIARRLVEMHEGRIAVVDKEGPGTRIEVVLPGALNLAP
jgi:signal transduction histidine kinase/energy-coupling factor transporter ATP-binding protein EcfA2